MLETPDTPTATPPEPPVPSAVPSRPPRTPVLDAVFDRVSGRRAVDAWGLWFSGALAAAGLVAFVAVGLLLWRQGWAREAAWGLGALLVAGGVIQGTRVARRRRSDDLATARAIEAVAPGLASDLLAARELRSTTRDADPVTAGLARAHVSLMEERARRLDLQHAAPLRLAPIGLAVLAVVVAAHVVVRSRGSDRVREAYAYLVFQASDSAPLLAPEPIAGDIVLTYRYPAHMRRAPRTVPGTAGDIQAPKGTRVELTARADRDLSQAFVLVGDVIHPLVVTGREVSGALLIDAPGEWRFRWANSSGRTIAEGPPRPISIEPDAFPEVKLSAPAAEFEVDGDEVISLKFEASDDYGLGTPELVYTRAGLDEERKPLNPPAENAKRHRADASWDLKALSLKPGERVTYRIEVVDNDAISGPKRASSQSQVLKVFSKTEHHREILKQAEEVWEKLLTGLGDRIEEPTGGEKGENVDTAWAAATKPHDDYMVRTAGELTSLGNKVVRDPRAPKEIGQALVHVGGRIQVAAGRTQLTRQSLVNKVSPPATRIFRSALAQEIAEDERGVLYLEDLIDRRKLLDLAEMARELQTMRQELTSLAEQFQKAPDEATKRRLMSEIARLKERVHELFKRMQELAKGIQDEHANREAEQLLDENDDLLSQLDQLQKDLANGDAEKALKALEEIQKQLEELEKKLDEQAGEASEEDEAVAQELRELASDLLDVEAEQQALKEESEKLRRELREKQEEMVERLGDDYVKALKQKAEQAKKELDGVDRELAESLAEDEVLNAANERLAQLSEALDGQDFEEAADQAQQALRHAREVKGRLEVERDIAEQYPDLERGGPVLKRSADRAGKGQKLVQEVSDELEKLLKNAKQPPSPQQREQMKKLAEKQQGVQRQTERMQQKLQKIGEKAPVFGPEQGRLLQEAANEMGGAKERLGQTDPRGAGAKQQAALEKLQAMKDAMKGQQQQGQGQPGGTGIPMPFASGNGSGEEGDSGFEARKVEIPTADQSQAPAEFRQDIIDAMKDDVPGEYEPQVRDYYQELVK